MPDTHRIYEIRCPVHGFIPLNDWEKEIIAVPAFQRLRRIRQLAWTDQVYPGAMHTRFEHSLGVMYVASQLYDSLVKRSFDILHTDLGYIKEGIERNKAIIRIAALLHDVGHGPFSHASEELMPFRQDGKQRYKHEQYTAAIVRRHFKDVIENHPLNTNWGITVETVAALLEGSATAGRALFWRKIISSQMDADRMDYLLRDALHTGVSYGRYDLHRLINTIEAIPANDENETALGIGEGGWHTAEALIVARYLMFTQVYFHKTRVAYDHHLRKTLSELLPNGSFPKPEDEGLGEYLEWDDWKVLGLLKEGKGGEHGNRLLNRNHYREVYHTLEVPNFEDLEELARAKDALSDLLAAEEAATGSWYKLAADADVPVVSEIPGRQVWPLSHYSSVVANLTTNRQTLLYVKPEDTADARSRLSQIGGK